MALDGRKFFDEHMAYIYANDIDGLIDNQYHPDCVLISPYDLYGNPEPPHIVRGREAVKGFIKDYMAWQGSIKIESLTEFCFTEEAISFQAVFTSNTGRWFVADGWYFKDGLVYYHFSYARKLG